MNLTGLFVNSLSLTEKWGKHELVKFNSNVSPLIARIKEATLNYPYTSTKPLILCFKIIL